MVVIQDQQAPIPLGEKQELTVKVLQARQTVHALQPLHPIEVNYLEICNLTGI